MIIYHKSIDNYFVALSKIPISLLAVAHGFQSPKFVRYLSHANKIVAVSESVKNYFSERLPHKDIDVLYNPITIPDKIKKKENAVPVIAIMCVFRRKKNIPLLLKAPHILHKMVIDSNWSSVVVDGKNSLSCFTCSG